MKNYRLWIGLLLVCCCLQTCRDDDSVMMGNVQFVFRASDVRIPGGRSLAEVKDGSVLWVSINKYTGDPVHVLKELTLIKFGDTFISDPLPLPKGHYNITDFLIANEDHQVLYAIPKEGSPMASLVEDPLPMAFTITENEVSDLSVEVVSVDGHQPEELGYVTFVIDVVKFFKLAVFVPAEDGTLKLTTAQAYILHGSDTLYNRYLLPTTNTVAFDADTDESYTLVLIKHSFMKYSRTFTIHELLNELDGNPLSIRMTPALTMVVDPYQGENGYEARFDMWALDPSLIGHVTIDWGDGSMEELAVPTTCCQEMKHLYPAAGRWFISISGDLDVVGYFSMYYYTPLDTISLRYLTELKSLDIEATVTPSIIDISYNTKLESVGFGMTRVTSLDISTNHRLKSVGLLFDVEFSVESLNQLIHDLLRNARDYHITEGDLVIVANGAGSGTIIGPPSDAALEELRILRDDYGWTIEPASAL